MGSNPKELWINQQVYDGIVEYNMGVYIVYSILLLKVWHREIVQVFFWSSFQFLQRQFTELDLFQGTHIQINYNPWTNMHPQ